MKKIYYVVRIDSYYDTDEYGCRGLDGKITTKETPLLDKGIFANAADAIVLVGDLLRKKKAELERDGYESVLVGNRVYAYYEVMDAYPACFTAYSVREREVIGP